MNDSDRMAAFLLARVRALEAVLGGLLAVSERCEEVKAVAARLLTLYEDGPSSQPMADEEVAIAHRGYEETFRAVFAESLPEK